MVRGYWLALVPVRVRRFECAVPSVVLYILLRVSLCIVLSATSFVLRF